MIGVAVFATLLVVVVPRFLERESPASGRGDASVPAVVREAAGPLDPPATALPPGGREAGGRIAAGAEVPPASPGAVQAQPAPTVAPVAAPTISPTATSRVADSAPPAAERPADPSGKPTPEIPRQATEVSPPPRPTSAARAAQEQGHPVAAKTLVDAPRPTPSGAKAPAQKGGFQVQVGVFADPEKARQLESRLAAKDFRVHSDTVTIASAVRTRVRVGPFATRAEAEKAAARLVAINEPAIIVKP